MVKKSQSTICAFLAVIAMAGTPSLAFAQQQASAAIALPEGVRLQSVSETEAKQVFDQLVQFQQGAREGRISSITLLSGGVASSRATLVTPRKTLVDLKLDKLKWIKKIETNDHSGTPFVFSIFPNGPGQIFWEVEAIWLGSKIRKVTILRKIPAPS